ncbi:MAG TPA: hypothetical protein VJ898_12700, partial [Natrialbaceae archaeon]|nr:hypothetical protein [Natrialbaceae archaeon]
MRIRSSVLVLAIVVAVAILGGSIVAATGTTAAGNDLAAEADLAVEEHGLASGISHGTPQDVATEFSTGTDEIYAFATIR